MSTQQPLSSVMDLCREYHMLPKGGTVLCAVSGGADSAALLHWLYFAQDLVPFTLVAAHYNHRLRGAESDRDEEFVRSFVTEHLTPYTVCTRSGPERKIFPPRLVVGSGDVAGEARQRRAGIEETARELRYAFLQQAARDVGADVIATAHNADDNAETVLLHLIRGCGLRGLTGIPPRRANIVRPLLTTPRVEIEAYLRIHSLPHVEDSTNLDDQYSRNRVRRHIIPQLKQINPWFTQNMAAATRLLRVDETYLALQAEDACRAARRLDGELAIVARCVAELSDAVAPRAVRRLIGMMTEGNDDCSAAHLDAVVALSRGKDPSAQVCLPNGLLARRVYDQLVFTTQVQQPPLEPTALCQDGETAPANALWRVACRRCICPEEVSTPTHFYLSQARCGQLVLRPRREGDALRLPHREGARTVKKYLIDAKIPRYRREQIPVLADGEGVAALAGFGPDAGRLARTGEAALELEFIPNF